MCVMISVTEVTIHLARLGVRLREARLARREPMEVFAQRLDISVPTLRAMESGSPTVAVGTWLTALWLLDRLGEVDGLLAPAESLLDKVRAGTQRERKRAPRRLRA